MGAWVTVNESWYKLVDPDDCGSRVDLDAGVERFFGRQHGKLRASRARQRSRKITSIRTGCSRPSRNPRPESISRANAAAGQTSIGQLRHLALRIFKIDRSLMRDAVINECSRKILHSLTDLGHELRFIVVA